MDRMTGKFLAALLLVLCLCLCGANGFLSAAQGAKGGTRRCDALATRRHLDVTSLQLSPSVVSIGDILLDCIATADARGLSLAEMVETDSWNAFPGGANANVATACSKLGTNTAFVGCVGADDDGDQLELLLQESDVDTSLMQRSNRFPTRRVMVTRSSQDIPGFAGFWEGRSAGTFADCDLDGANMLEQDNDLHIIDRASWLVCGTLSLAYEKSRDAVYKFVERGLSQGNNTRLYVDVNWRQAFWPSDGEDLARKEIMKFTQQASIIKMTDEEVEWLLGIPAAEALSNPQSVHSQHFPNALGVLLTAGENGVAWSLLGSVGHMEAFSVDVVETTGAGDAFTAGFLHSLMAMEGPDLIDLRNQSVPEKERNEIIFALLEFACAVAALTCTKEGAIPAQPTYDEVESFLSRKSKI